jgi:hypothetical protein
VRKFGLLALAVLLLLAWVVSWVVFKVTTGLIHLLLVFALIAGVMHFVGDRRDGA